MQRLENLVLKDFNIEDEAGGVNKPLTRNFTAVVADNSLKIHFYWDGKGTNGIPVRRVYGPLISAISVDLNLKGLDLHTGSFSLRQIKAATNNFNLANKIGKCGLGPVYKLYGCCIESNQLLLVYEYLEHNNLARALFGPEEHQLQLDWPTRHKICIGIARGLSYLHEESRLKIIHRDIKATNVLLDKHLVPKLSDFGLAKLDEEDNTHISTRVAGTFGYMAPEYAIRGYLTDKADVYIFGIVILEVINARSNTSMNTKDDCFYLLDWVNTLKEKGNLMELVDSRLESSLNKEEVMTAINVGLLCTNTLAAERPSMSAVVSMLEGRADVQQFISDMSVSVAKENLRREDDGGGRVYPWMCHGLPPQHPLLISIQLPWILITRRREISSNLKVVYKKFSDLRLILLSLQCVM
ncbi:Leucine-rich repeat transmembrane protein kinase [Perilla frutescens var. frutescens]|nr:Leucine-rich repeat transmembrane protein kinase [Perilla frutescens var. frutescens]